MSTTTLPTVRFTVRSVMDFAGGSGVSLYVPAAPREDAAASPAACTAGDSGADLDASAGGGGVSLGAASAPRWGVASATVGTTIGAVGAQACRGPRVRTPAARSPRRVSWIFIRSPLWAGERVRPPSCVLLVHYRRWVPAES